ncbi:MAG: hypothetical protein R6X22_07600 [Gemmatimonadota bacterium]
MDRIRTVLVAGTLCVLAATPAAAQDMARVCGSLEGVKKGDWASFNMEGAPAAQVSAVRFAFVDRGTASEPWFEVKATTPQGDQIVQLQVPGFPFGADEISAGIVKLGMMPAMRTPEQMLGMMRQQMASSPMLDIQKQCLASELVGEETLEGPNGNLKTWHLRMSGGREAWLSSSIPFGMVKGSSADDGTMVLTGFGRDAKSSILEEPQVMPSMGNVPQRD